MIRVLALAALLAAPAAAQDVRACVGAADRDPGAERACIGVEALACIDASAGGQTTAGMADCYRAETAAWDDLLNATHADLVTLAATQAADGGAPVDQERLLREAQRAWTAFRDADCAQTAAQWGIGSMREVAGAECALERTATRALELIEKRRAFESP